MKLEDCEIFGLEKYTLIEFRYKNTVENRAKILQALEDEFGILNFSIQRIGPVIKKDVVNGLMKVKILNGG